MAEQLDIAVLGDTQPEGLLAAAGLVRKGYQVGVVSSHQLGELPMQIPWPLRFPERIGSNRLEDLLFRAGFFKLEDSGLVPTDENVQVLLKKHRLSLNGSRERWKKELQREFPQWSDSINQLQEDKRKRGWRAKSSVLSSLLDRDRALEQWVYLETLRGRFDPSDIRSQRSVVASRWLERVQRPARRCFRIDPKLSKPLSQLLLEHARRWGVHMLDEPLRFSAGWGNYHLNSDVSARNLVVNSYGALRFLAKHTNTVALPQPLYWLYFDRISCSLESVPEPLEEFSFLHMDESGFDVTETRLLHLRREPAKDLAVLTIGSWLPFEEARSWQARIERGRQLLRRVVPFLNSDVWKPIPEPLELAEMKGECVRRGELERLILSQYRASKWKSLWNFSWWKSPKPLEQIGKRLFILTPYLRLDHDRDKSLEACMKLLDSFDKKTKQAKVK